ncbi:hypothetical protein IPC413_01305 [Pseudomonas aeruginosa]|uniref:hypothetical protein n=1 Tax=Pseudomonas aeruginosa TaxID=287 RepID=UPI000F865B4E|nr:hypothetical protein [Pseudomonas aeruginosa]EIU1610282.1 hypothetical protein [Pseudomonas aeruginosa]EIU1616772.1 hypothetical protein [Pseudomonas aeruginosa]EKU1142408.1 hypothetical protein [Pseudomonas aeruginosa]EKU1915847.1 hypothetical protein [Pseudomonas aeruginosa]EKU1969785.1 hypothetical protein [Pseudomonas aeruginosa]
MTTEVHDQEIIPVPSSAPAAKRSWVGPTITTLIGIIVTLLVAWYQIALSDEQAQQAELERSKAVKNELTQIVEEHVLNGMPLDISRLSRLAELRARQEKLLVAPLVSEVIESAEFNILKSQYLKFDRKKEIKVVFDSIYNDLSPKVTSSYKGLFKSSVDGLYSSIQAGNNSEAMVKLDKLLGDFNSKVDELSPRPQLVETKSFDEIARVLLAKPGFFIFAFVIYCVILFAWYSSRRRRRLRRVEDEIFNSFAFKHRNPHEL